MKLVTIDFEKVSFQNTDHSQFGNIAYLWDRDDFNTVFGIEIPAGLQSMGYEPSRSLYVYATDIDSPVFIDSPADYATMNAIHNDLTNIENTAISGTYTAYEFNGSTWAIDPATQSGIDWADLRDERDNLLATTDFFMTVDYYNDKLAGQEQTDIKTYREELRDLPGATSDPTDPAWPTKPQIVIDNGI